MRRRTTTALIALTAVLAMAATALAAHPKARKHYSGETSGIKVNGFKPKATFTVSANGKTLLHFSYQTFGCFGFGGRLTPGVNYYNKPWNTMVLGSISVKSNGTFSVKNVKSTYAVKVQGATQKTVTTSTVSGHFKNAKTAVGQITFGQKFSMPGAPGSACGPATVTFTAKTA